MWKHLKDSWIGLTVMVVVVTVLGVLLFMMIEGTDRQHRIALENPYIIKCVSDDGTTIEAKVLKFKFSYEGFTATLPNGGRINGPTIDHCIIEKDKGAIEKALDAE